MLYGFTVIEHYDEIIYDKLLSLLRINPICKYNI